MVMHCSCINLLQPFEFSLKLKQQMKTSQNHKNTSFN